MILAATIRFHIHDTLMTGLIGKVYKHYYEKSRKKGLKGIEMK